MGTDQYEHCCISFISRLAMLLTEGSSKLTVCDPKAVLELRLNAQLIEPDVDFWPTAMHHHWPHSHR